MFDSEQPIALANTEIVYLEALSSILLLVFSKIRVGDISAQNVPIVPCASLSGHGKASKLSAIGAAALRQGVGYA